MAVTRIIMAIPEKNGPGYTGFPRQRKSRPPSSSKIISLNYWQWDDTLLKRRFYDSESSIGYITGWLCGFGIELSHPKHRKLLSLHL